MYRLITIFLVAIAFIGCETSSQNRKVVGNTLFSESFPKMNLEVDDVFHYIGHDKSHLFTHSLAGGLNTSSEKTDSYLFAEVDDSNQIKRFIRITVSRLLGYRWHYLDNYSKDWEHITRGDVRLGNEKYWTCTTAVLGENLPFADLIEAREIRPNTSYMLKYYERTFNNDKYKLFITYAEDCTQNLEEVKNLFDKKNVLTVKQKLILEEFEQRSINAFKIN